jgi:hypothetical protein
VLGNIERDTAHSLTQPFREAIEAIKRFAGPDPARTRYYPEDEGFLLDLEAER